MTGGDAGLEQSAPQRLPAQHLAKDQHRRAGGGSVCQAATKARRTVSWKTHVADHLQGPPHDRESARPTASQTPDLRAWWSAGTGIDRSMGSGPALAATQGMRQTLVAIRRARIAPSPDPRSGRKPHP